MPPAATPLHTALEEDLRAFLRQHGIVVWLDKHGHYSDFVRQLAERHQEGGFPYPVFTFDGSYLGLMLALENCGNDLDPEPLLIHLPGHNDTSIRQTPLLELYKAGRRYRKALSTLVTEVATGRVAPDELQRFLDSPDLTLNNAETWLASMERSTPSGLAARLEALDTNALAEALLTERAPLLGEIQEAGETPALRELLLRRTGMNDAWLGVLGLPALARDQAGEVAQALGGWILAVEYVHDLRGAPHTPGLEPLRALAAGLVQQCRELAAHLRDHHPRRYARLADDTESRLPAEKSLVRADELGEIDTFRFEEEALLTAAVQALRNERWSEAADLVRERTEGSSFWLRHNRERRWVWQLIGEAAELGSTIEASGRPLLGARNLDEAVERYTAGAFEVDRAHRRFEQRRRRLGVTQVPHFGELLEIGALLRRLYRAWADRLARDFSALCTEQGFLPDSGARQRTWFTQVVEPLIRTRPGATPETVAVLLVDALRYEMAAELAERLRGAGTTLRLEAWLAELPTLTAVGMNALAPVTHSGRLVPAGIESGTFGGFRSGEFTVRGPADRARAMGMAVTGALAPRLDLGKLLEMPPASLKGQVSKARGLLVVTSSEIDDAGEEGFGLDLFERVLESLEAAWHRLQEAGVRRFVFTSDHGFLLQDETCQVRPFGKKTDPHRRWVLDAAPRREPGTVTVALSALGYDAPEGWLIFPEDTAVFSTPAPGATYVHGGNSLQERVIPSLVVERKRPAGRGGQVYEIEAEARPDFPGRRGISLRVRTAPGITASLGFTGPSTVGLALRVPGRPDVTLLLQDAEGPGRLRDGRLEVPVGGEWSQLTFSLEGPRDERVPVEIYHPEGVEEIAPLRLVTLFSVAGTALPGRLVAAPPSEVTPWEETIEDESFRHVFLHLEQHGSINEHELTGLLGSARRVRAFARSFEELVAKVPFRVLIETVTGMKRYVKGGEN